MGGSYSLSEEPNTLESENEQQIPMSLKEYQLYGRQMIVDDMNGLEGQLKLRNAKIVVVGVGGLGCPALLYLAASGVGTIGIVDDDVVDISNLHRQVMHSANNAGMSKCESAKRAIAELNPYVHVNIHPKRLNSQNAFEIFEGYEIVLDCTDAPISRYLISDVAVSMGLTMVSASGLKTEGQLSIYNFKGVGPCYRCFYPTPPVPNSVTSCESGGVIGPCIGLVGIMIAVETMKILLGIYTIENFTPFLMQYSGFPQQTLRTFKMRNKSNNCASCGSHPTITRSTITAGKVDYYAFCGSRNFDVCSNEERITVQEFEESYRKQLDRDYTLIDVRSNLHYGISHLHNTYNVSLKDLESMEGDVNKLLKRVPKILNTKEVILCCTHGNESRLALRLLKDKFKIKNVKDIIGGYYKYIDEINPSIPKF